MSISNQGRLEHLGVALQEDQALDISGQARWLAFGLIAHCGGLVGRVSFELAGRGAATNQWRAPSVRARGVTEGIGPDRSRPRPVGIAALVGQPDAFFLARERPVMRRASDTRASAAG